MSLKNAQSFPWFGLFCRMFCLKGRPESFLYIILGKQSARGTYCRVSLGIPPRRDIPAANAPLLEMMLKAAVQTKMNSETPRAKPVDKGPRRNLPDKVDAAGILVFLIPFFQWAQIRIIGVLTGSDALFLLSFFFLASRFKLRAPTALAKRFIILCLFWLLSQIATDLIRHTPLPNLARTWSSISVTLAAFMVLFTLLYGRPRRIVIYGWGSVFGSIVAFFASPNIFAADDPWKFGLAMPVTLGVVLLASRKEFRGNLSVQLLLIIGIINMFLGARSMGGVCLVAAVYVFLARNVHKKKAVSVKFKTRTKVAIAISLLLSVGGLGWAYQYVAGSGMLGEDAQSKFRTQSVGKYGLLLGGRTEILGSLPAIYDSPLIGHGSDAKEPKYLLIEQETLAVLGYDQVASGFGQSVEEGSGAIPTHSYIFSAWVWAGVLGGVFWAWVWSLTVRTLFRAYPRTLHILPLVTFCALGLLWDILFSPYGTYSRVTAPFYVVIFMSCLEIVPPKATKPAQALAISQLRLHNCADGAGGAA